MGGQQPKVIPQKPERPLPLRRAMPLFFPRVSKNAARRALDRWFHKGHDAGDPCFQKIGGRLFVSTRALLNGEAVGDLLRRGRQTGRVPKLWPAYFPSRNRSAAARLKDAAGHGGWQRLIDDVGGEQALLAIIKTISRTKLSGAERRLSIMNAWASYARKQSASGRRRSVEKFAALPQNKFRRQDARRIREWLHKAETSGLVSLLLDRRGLASKGATADVGDGMLAREFARLRSLGESSWRSWRICEAIATLTSRHCPDRGTLDRHAEIVGAGE